MKQLHFDLSFQRAAKKTLYPDITPRRRNRPDLLRRSPAILLVILTIITLAGCSFQEARRQAAAVENIGYIEGTVLNPSDRQGTMVALLFRNDNNIPVRLEGKTVADSGYFKFSVLPGSYFVAAFLDDNNDNRFQQGEYGAMHGTPASIEVAPKQTVILEPITILGPPPKPDNVPEPITEVQGAMHNIGQIVTLNDPRFKPENYTLGFWHPITFLEQAEGGLFFLEAYSPAKTPVLFVHGALGGPGIWTSILESLDRDRFQPWLLYYPSGLRLDIISDYMVEAVTRLQRRYNFTRIDIVAHSMGGLVTRSFVKKYIAHNTKNVDTIGLVMTINSPMNGIASAAVGIKHSPIVVPAWRDVAPASGFLRDINSWRWPDRIPYYLIISYVQGKSGDGTASLQSQAPLKLQNEAYRTILMEDSHEGILVDKTFLKIFNKILADNTAGTPRTP